MCDVQYKLLLDDYYQLGNGSNTIGNAFSGATSCKQSNLTVPKTYNGKEIRVIGKGALQDLSLTSLTILAPIIKICMNGIRNLPLKQLILPPTVKAVEYQGVYHFSLLELVILPKGFNPTSLDSYFLGAVYKQNCIVKYCGYRSFDSISFPYSVSSLIVQVPLGGPSKFGTKDAVKTKDACIREINMMYSNGTYSFNQEKSIAYILIFILIACY